MKDVTKDAARRVQYAEFYEYLRDHNVSLNTVDSYLFGVDDYFQKKEKITQARLRDYVDELAKRAKPRTVNLRVCALRKYLEMEGRVEIAPKPVRVQKSYFTDDVISFADYECLKKGLKRDGNWLWYFIVRYLGATGARVSEFIQFKVESVQVGYLDMYGKGNKHRRLWIPAALQKETLKWLARECRDTGPLWIANHGGPITNRGIGGGLKRAALKYGVDPRVAHPHSFRHMFAKRFFEKHSDLALLADLLGHEDLNVTRIYLRKTAGEQKAILDKVITW